MKRWAALGMIFIIIALLCMLSATAIDPADFTGSWYSVTDQSVYHFHDGLIQCTQHSVPLSDRESISGAYIFNRDSIVLFAVGINELETVHQLYLIQNGSESYLCENQDGSGNIYFIRNN